MSLISERRRQELENKSVKELTELIKKERRRQKKPDRDLENLMKETTPEKEDEYAFLLAKKVKRTLTKERFWELADLSKSLDKKAEKLGLSRGTVLDYRSSLIVLGVIRPYRSRYSKDDLKKIDQRFPTWVTLRKEINRLVKKNEELSLGEIADRLCILKAVSSQAFGLYGIRYKAYSNLDELLRFESKKGNLKRTKKDGRYFYKFKRRLPTATESREKKYLKKRAKYLNALKKLGLCSVTEISKELRITDYIVRAFIKELAEKDDVGRVKRIKKREGVRDFFSKAFPGAGYLLYLCNNEDHLEELTKKMIDCLPNQIYPWMIKHIDSQLDELITNGLPVVVYDKVKEFYAERL